MVAFGVGWGGDREAERRQQKEWWWGGAPPHKAWVNLGGRGAVGPTENCIRSPSYDLIQTKRKHTASNQDKHGKTMTNHEHTMKKHANRSTDHAGDLGLLFFCKLVPF